MKIKILSFLILCSLILTADQKDKKIYIHSDYKQIKGDIMLLSGNVEIRFGTYIIYADEVEFNNKKKDIIARGRVTVVSSHGIINGDKLFFNTKTRRGKMHNVYGKIHPSVKYLSNSINQIDNDTVKFDDFTLTSCTQLNPIWKIFAKKGKIVKKKYVDMKHVIFRIKNIPVFYLPFIRYPLTEDGRSTGFLFPNFGSSSRRGSYIMNSFYWNMKPNLDLTLNFDYFSNAGMGFSNEFRYLFKQMSGDIKFYYFQYFLNDSNYNVFNKLNSDDYYLNIKHIHNIKFLNTKITASIDRQSDPSFLSLFSNNFYARLVSSYNSAISVSSSLSGITLGISASENKRFFNEKSTATVMTYLPVISLNMPQKKIWKIPGYFSLRLNYQNSERSGERFYEEEADYSYGISSSKFIIKPSYRLNWLKIPWLTSVLNLESNYSFFSKRRDTETNEILEEPLSTNYHTASINLKGPALFRDFETKKGRYKHLIEPQLNFKYVTAMENSDQIVRIDSTDFPSFSKLSFLLTSRLLYREKLGQNTNTRDILTFSISQDYYFDPKEAHRERKINGEYPEFSELSNKLKFSPAENFSIQVSLNYNYFIKDVSRLNLGINFGEAGSPVNGRFFLTKYKSPYVTNTNYMFNRTTIGGSLNVDINNFPLKLISSVNYDLTTGEFRLGSIMCSLKLQCLRINAELKIYNFLNSVEYQINFGISLGNLGMLKDFFGDRKE